MTYLNALKHILESLLDIYEPGEAVSIASIVLKDAFGIKLKQVSDNQTLSEEQQRQLEIIISRLNTHEPVQYVLGKTVFYGLPLKVNPNVLIPRQETEELAAWIIETVDFEKRLRSAPPAWRLLDIGTGSGCIPIAVKKKRPGLEVHALDVSEGALEIAKENATFNHTAVHFYLIDILEEKQWKGLPSFDLISSNPPYITEHERKLLPRNVLEFEPHLALFSGDDDAQRFVKKIADFALLLLNPGGYLFFETNEFFAPDSQRILAEKGFTELELRKDLNEKDRMLRARKPAG
jgi:release factor glutamine methyltransferase